MTVERVPVFKCTECGLRPVLVPGSRCGACALAATETQAEVVPVAMCRRCGRAPASVLIADPESASVLRLCRDCAPPDEVTP